MNSLRTMFIGAILVVVLYGAYVVINRNPDSTAPTGPATDWSESAAVDWSGAGKPPLPGGPAGSAVAPPFAPSGPHNAPAGQAPPAVALPRAVDPPDTTNPLFGRSATTTPPYSAPPYSAASSPAESFPPAGGVEKTNSQISTPHVLAPPPPGTEAAGQPTDDTYRDFSSFIEAVRLKLSANRLAEAHLMLSRRYREWKLSPAEARQIEVLLDQLAGTIVYSRQHLLEPAYRVGPGETLQQIARRFNVPTRFLANVNRIGDSEPLQPGQELKVLRGPFCAEIDLGKRELTLMLDQRYAGRFPIGIGRRLQNVEGTFRVTDKTIGPTSYDSNGVADPSNPLGRRWIGLGDDLGLHGTNNPQNIGRDGGQGWINLAKRDIEDLYDILSVGSTVIIQR